MGLLNTIQDDSGGDRDLRHFERREGRRVRPERRGVSREGQRGPRGGPLRLELQGGITEFFSGN